MSSGGDDERRVKRKHDAPREKPLSRHGRGATGSSGVARDRGSRDEQIQQEEALERARRVIPPDGCSETTPHLDEFDPSYLRDYDEDVVEKRANDTR